LYAEHHNGRFPQRLDELLGGNEPLSPEAVECAVTGQATVFVSPDAVANDLTFEDVVAYEPLSAHEGKGSHVLYGDGHVSWQTASEFERDLSRSKSRAAARSTR
jgi:prepilin-type processing-associated H-X9-DG protein